MQIFGQVFTSGSFFGHVTRSYSVIFFGHLNNPQILSQFSCFFLLFPVFGWKTKKKHILISSWSVQHPNAVQNIQHLFVCLCVCLSVRYTYLSMCLSVFLSICQCVYLSFCLSVYLSVPFCLFVYLSICLSVSVFLSICLSVFCLSVFCLFVYLSVPFCFFVYLSMCRCVYLSFCLFVCLSTCVPICPFVYLSICLSVFLFFCPLYFWHFLSISKAGCGRVMHQNSAKKCFSPNRFKFFAEFFFKVSPQVFLVSKSVNIDFRRETVFLVKSIYSS